MKWTSGQSTIPDWLWGRKSWFMWWDRLLTASLDGGGGGGRITDGGRRNEWNLRREKENKSSCLSQADSFSPQVDLSPAPCHCLCCWHSVPSWQQIKKSKLGTYFKLVVIKLYFCPSCISEYWIRGKEINTKVSENLSFALLSKILVNDFGTDMFARNSDPLVFVHFLMWWLFFLDLCSLVISDSIYTVCCFCKFFLFILLIKCVLFWKWIRYTLCSGAACVIRSTLCCYSQTAEFWAEDFLWSRDVAVIFR